MYKAFLSLRYLRTRYIALASILSVMLGVATMIVVNSVMKGFTSEMRSRIQGLLSDIVIETNSLDGAENAREMFKQVRSVAGEKIHGMTATVEVWGLITFPFAGQFTTRPITLIGIEPEGKASVGPFKQYLESYHAVLDGKKVVRPALRSPKEPSGLGTDRRRGGLAQRDQATREMSQRTSRQHPRIAGRRRRVEVLACRGHSSCCDCRSAHSRGRGIAQAIPCPVAGRPGGKAAGGLVVRSRLSTIRSHPSRRCCNRRLRPPRPRPSHSTNRPRWTPA